MIIVGTDYRIHNTLDIDLTGMTSAIFSIQAPNGSLVELSATASGTYVLVADVTFAQNTTLGEHRIWAEIDYDGVIRKSGAKTYTVWAEGALQI